jgi:catechol 2,3-dioxygenase-like lactoylglutathione lyase family enzyme
VNKDHLDHIAISVNNLKDSLDWYTKNFVCQIIYQDDSWAYLEFANIKLALVVPKQHPPHIAFAKTNAEIYGELKTHRDGSRSTYVKDPSGNSVEILKA